MSTNGEKPTKKAGPSFWSDSRSPQATGEFGSPRIVFDRSLRSTVYLTALCLSVLVMFGISWSKLSAPTVSNIAVGIIAPLALAVTAWFSAPRQAGEETGAPSWGGRFIGVLPGLFTATIAIVVMVKG